jgi:AcrR family transcriptional regulator
MSAEAAARRRSRRAERKEQTRAELIEAAAKVFVKRGFHGASVEQIAAEAGYTTGAIYWHFSGKDELFLAVYERYALRRVAELSQIHREGSGELPQRARAYADHWMARLAKDPTFMLVSLEFLVHVWRNPALRDAFADRIAAPRLALARFLEAEAESSGLEYPLPAGDLATVLRELGTGLGLAKLADPDAVRDDLFGDFVESFFELVTGAA